MSPSSLEHPFSQSTLNFLYSLGTTDRSTISRPRLIKKGAFPGFRVNYFITLPQFVAGTHPAWTPVNTGLKTRRRDSSLFNRRLNRYAPPLNQGGIWNPGRAGTDPDLSLHSVSQGPGKYDCHKHSGAGNEFQLAARERTDRCLWIIAGQTALLLHTLWLTGLQQNRKSSGRGSDSRGHPGRRSEYPSRCAFLARQ